MIDITICARLYRQKRVRFFTQFDDIYRYLLQESAKDMLNRQLRSGITDDDLTDLVIRLRDANRLCHIQEEKEPQEPQIICSSGLFSPAE